MKSNGHHTAAGQPGKVSILNLPIAPSLPHFLTPDPAVPSVKQLLALSEYDSQHPPKSDKPGQDGYKPRPTILRRSRQVKEAHFSYVTPLPLSFPYAVRPGQVKRLRKVTGEAVGDGTGSTNGAGKDKATNQNINAKDGSSRQITDVEDYLASLEPDLADGVIKAVGSDKAAAYTSDDRRQSTGNAVLVGLSAKTLTEVLPNLDVGDAWEHLASGQAEEGGREARSELTSFLAGHIVRAELPEGQNKFGFAPWSLCYGGHQFGSWASQLGDGRAISILTTPAKWPVYHEGTYYPPVAELQLKGAGRTPYSRFADGLAVLRSSVREYLGSEAMAALGIPTSRALSLVHLPNVDVQRETMETAAIVCRVAPSWLRIGCFELPWSRDEWDILRDLVSYAGREVFGFGKSGVSHDNEPDDKSLAAKVLRETSRRTARLVAGWQATGFMHGVLNTDNISIAGLTIDYGPYAWMDIYSANHICNHSDEQGRYSYRNQPPICVEAMQRLGSSLAELIGCELELAGNGRMVSAAQRGWAKETDKLDGWRNEGLRVVDEIASEFTGYFVREYRYLMGKRLGITNATQEDFTNLFDPMLSLMSDHHLDFSRTFRLLTQFTTTESPNFNRFLDMLCPKKQVPAYLHNECHQKWTAWLKSWQTRMELSEQASGQENTSRRERMKRANPRFILRQWVLEEAISRLDKDNDVAFLQRVLDMATHPFEDYGEDLVDPAMCARPTPDIEEQRRLCEVGDEQMLGFQCSCSS